MAQVTQLKLNERDSETARGRERKRERKRKKERMGDGQSRRANKKQRDDRGVGRLGSSLVGILSK